MFMQPQGWKAFLSPQACRTADAWRREHPVDGAFDLAHAGGIPDPTMFEEAVENSVDGVAVVDLQGALVYINVSGACQFDLETSPLQQGVSWSALWCEDCAEVAEHALESARSGRSCRFTARPRRWRDMDRWLDVTVTPTLDGRGRPQQMLCIARDITELKHRALEAQQAWMTEIDHRIKNSLTSVASLLSLQARRIEDPAARASLQQARARIMAVAEVHRHLCESGRHESVDVGECICAVAHEAVGALCGERHVRLELACPRGIMLHADRATTLALITTELVTNCLKHAFTSAGTIRIALRAHEATVCLEVEDDGCGLPEGFDPHTSGGVGMKVITTLIRSLDGTLSAERQVRGARMRVVLPCQEAARRPSPPGRGMHGPAPVCASERA